MISILFIITFILCLVTIAKHDIHMFQQNSYRIERYHRWWIGGNFLTYRRWWFLVVFALSFSVWTQPIAILIMAFYTYRRFNVRHKSPLVITSRVKRLFATDVLLVTAVVVVEMIWLDHYNLLPAILSVILLLSNGFMLLANIVNTPLEMAISRWYYNDAKQIIRSHKKLIIIGVTGSYGKTSTKNYLYRMLSEKYNVLVTPGNFNTTLGVVRTIREHLRPQHQIFIVEMGAKQRGDIREICDLVRPSIGIVSSVGEAHLETFGSVENIQKTKFELIESLPDGGVGVVNFDSKSIRNFTDFKSKCKILSYSVEDEAADFQAKNVCYNASGLSFDLKIGDEVCHFNSHLLGEGNVLNLCAGVIVANHLGVSTKSIQIATSQLKPVEHRLSMQRSGGLTILDDAYNSNPDGARMALAVLRDFARGERNKRVVITPGFVEMGANQYEANYNLGKVMAESCDYAVVVNKLNREAICKGLKDAEFSDDKLFVANSLNAARQHLAGVLKVGDIVLYENDLPDSFK